MSEMFSPIQETDDGDIVTPDGMFDEVRYTRPDEDEYMVRQPRGDFGRWTEWGGARENHENEVKTMDRSARLVQSKELNGFYPHKPEELVQVTALSDDIYKGKNGAAKYLNEILIFRKKHEEAHKNDEETYDPAAALRSIVRSWDSYVKESRGDVTALQLLQDQLADKDVSPLATITSLSGIANWKDDGLTHRAIAAITREYDTRQFAEEKGPDLLGTNYVAKDKALLEHEASLIKNMRIHEARGIVDSLITDQRRRMEFWKNRLEAAGSHLSVRTLAKEALERYL